MAELITASMQIAKGFDKLDFDRKTVMRGLNQAARMTRTSARRLLRRGRVSRPGEVPASRTGAMRRNVAVKSNSRALWSQVHVKTIQGSNYYPAVLKQGYSKNGRTLLPREDFIAKGAQINSTSIQSAIDDAVLDAIKIWR